MAKQSQLSAEKTAVPVLLTRPVGRSTRFGAALTTRFPGRVRLVLTPLMQTVFLAPDIPQADFSAVVFTSEAAVEATRRLHLTARLPVDAFCVGVRTAQAAAAAGFRARYSEGDSGALLAMLAKQPLHGPLLYLHGRDTRGSLAERLVAAGIATVSALVYRQDAQPLTEEALDVLTAAGPVVVPLFSPRSADLFRQALPTGVKSSLAIAAISPAVADAAQALCPAHLQIAASPDAAAMLAAVEQLLIGWGSS